MGTSLTTYSQNTADSQTEKLVSQKFALLAKVGHQKKKLSESLGEAILYSGIVSELLAELKELTQEQEDRTPLQKQASLERALRLRNLTRELFENWPKDSELSSLRYNLLTSAGLENEVTLSEDGCVSLSSTRGIELLGMSIGATKEESLSLLTPS